MRIAKALTAAAAMAAAPAMAHALETSAQASVLSDYRWRGVSMSGGAAAAQVAVSAEADAGWWAAGELNSVSEESGDAELGASAGLGGAGPAANWSAGVAAYAYPGASDYDYYYASLSAERTFGAFIASTGYEYAPRQHALSEDDSYLWADLSYATRAGVDVRAHLGWNDGYYAGAEPRTDYAIGASVSARNTTFELSYVDAQTVSPAIVLSMSVAVSP